MFQLLPVPLQALQVISYTNYSHFRNHLTLSTYRNHWKCWQMNNNAVTAAVRNEGAECKYRSKFCTEQPQLLLIIGNTSWDSDQAFRECHHNTQETKKASSLCSRAPRGAAIRPVSSSQRCEAMWLCTAATVLMIRLLMTLSAQSKVQMMPLSGWSFITPYGPILGHFCWEHLA